MKERTTVQTSLLGIAKKAKSEKRYRFRNLYRELNEEMLRDSWRLLRKDAALGVDRVSAAEYEANLEENIRQLVERLKRKRYRARLVRRHYIPKGDGRMRPLGIPAIVAAEKTRVIPFSRYRRGETSFDFLGFEFRWGTDRKGQARLQRRTSRKKFRGSLKRAAEWCKENRHLRMKEQFRRLNAKLRGYYNYYGVNGNYASLNEFFHQ